MRNRRKRRLKNFIPYLFLLSVIVLAGIIYLYPKFTNAFVRTSLVEYGSLKVSKEENCYFIRKEKIVQATGQGRMQYYAKEGELVRKGAKVAELMGPKVAYLAEENGIISYYSDNLESDFTLENAYNLSKSDLISFPDTFEELRPETVSAGDPIYKIVDNTEWYIVVWSEKENSMRYEKGKSIRVILPLGEVKGNIYDIIDTGDAWMVIMQFSRYYEDMAKHRQVMGEVITSDLEGLVIENKNITSREGMPGVLVKDIGGQFNFRPVSVIGTDGIYSLVENSYFNKMDNGENVKVRTVEAYDEIMNNPGSEQDE